MVKNKQDWREQQRLQGKAKKLQDQTHISYCWLRADQAQVQLEQLKRSHVFTPVCLDTDMDYFHDHIKEAVDHIQQLKDLIRKREQELKAQKEKGRW